MKLIHHKTLTKKKWFAYSLAEQMANVGSEVERTIIWREKNPEYSRLAFERALELLDLTKLDPKNKNHRLKELCRTREMLVDWFLDNEYHSTDKTWQNYFMAFNYLARIDK
ncbi:MAG: Uncharacterized protein Athens101428_502 [Candidatus Berkelbacteria bacterium Athens1014_28]|uniref:Uncharacterized protein n=1 Tax=Candidatus Berkelbacteria bacterium Athens1014_28 TaxID=2017145 RepID=A0A554LLZ2_9BACT|nr:MAG: Uncharacterized protein Athens101428_502 [Candidatus Berkelbacteria bacterium Athens1014_28]